MKDSRIDRGLAAAAGGGLVWLALIVASRVGWAKLDLIELLFLLAPLVVVPLGLRRIPTPDGTFGSVDRAVRALQPLAALLVAAAFPLPPGTSAALLSSGWLALTGAVGLLGLVRFISRPSRWEIGELCVTAAMLFLPVGAGGLLMSRMGLTPLGFQEPIVLLFAVHYHYTGFAAPLIAEMTGRKLPSTAWRKAFTFSAAGIVLGTALLASGFALNLPLLKVSAALWISLGVGVLAVVMAASLPGARSQAANLLLGISTASVLVGMMLAAIYAVGEFLGLPWIDIPRMAQLHGILNAVGFSLCGLAAGAVMDHE